MVIPQIWPSMATHFEMTLVTIVTGLTAWTLVTLVVLTWKNHGIRDVSYKHRGDGLIHEDTLIDVIEDLQLQGEGEEVDVRPSVLRSRFEKTQRTVRWVLGSVHTRKNERESEHFLRCLKFFLWSLLIFLWSFSLSRSLSLSVQRPLNLMNESFYAKTDYKRSKSATLISYV